MSCRKVVIIDDEPIICNLIKRLGEWDRLNLEIVGSATDGLEGYRLIRELHPDIVLLDIRMPGLDGLELIEKCSEEKLTSRFIIISGYQEFEYAKKAIHFNISDYLVKPIDREELNMALKKSCHATAGLSFCKAEAGLLTECLRQARFSLNCRFLNERGSAYLYSEISSSFVAELLPVLTDDSWGEKLRLAFTNLDSSAFKRLLASIYVGDVGIQGVKSRLALQRFSNELFSVAGSFGEFDQAAEEKRNYTNWLCETVEKPKQLYEEAGRILEKQFSRYLESQMMWNDRHVRAALRYISAHFSEDIQLDDLAAAVGLNPAYLSGLLKNKTGMTYSEHLLKARMERAKELLAGSNAIVKSVCYEVGYRDVKYFSRLFRQYTGVNPSIYQKMHSIL